MENIGLWLAASAEDTRQKTNSGFEENTAAMMADEYSSIRCCDVLCRRRCAMEGETAEADASNEQEQHSLCSDGSIYACKLHEVP